MLPAYLGARPFEDNGVLLNVLQLYGVRVRGRRNAPEARMYYIVLNMDKVSPLVLYLTDSTDMFKPNGQAAVLRNNR